MIVRKSNMQQVAEEVARTGEPATARIPLHADDEVGRAAHEAAIFVSGFDFLLLAAASPNLDRARRADSLAKVFTVWPQIAARMAVLEAAAPKSAAAGQDEYGRLQDFIEGRV